MPPLGQLTVTYLCYVGYAAAQSRRLPIRWALLPLALVTPDTPVIAILTESSNPTKTINNVKQVGSRGAPLTGITSTPEHSAHLDTTFEVPSCGPLEPVVGNVALQPFAYHVADAKDRPIDKPRNLAKSVTVE